MFNNLLTLTLTLTLTHGDDQDTRMATSMVMNETENVLEYATAIICGVNAGVFCNGRVAGNSRIFQKIKKKSQKKKDANFFQNIVFECLKLVCI